MPTEAFQPRHEIREGSSPPIHLEDCSPSDLNEGIETVAIENRTSQLRIRNLEPVPEFDFAEPLVEALHYHANKGKQVLVIAVLISPSAIWYLAIWYLAIWLQSYIIYTFYFRRRPNSCLCLDCIISCNKTSNRNKGFRSMVSYVC